MPEIKNTFIAGRLNKDLDERLIGQGEYRDALNVNVGTSESSDASTVENILGNEIKGPGFADLTTTRTVTTPGTPGVDAIPPVPAGPDVITIEEQELSVVSYTPYTPATAGTPGDATQTMTLNAPLFSNYPVATPLVRTAQLFVSNTSAAVGDTTISVIAFRSDYAFYHSTFGTYRHPLPVAGTQVAFVSDSGLVGTHTTSLSSSQRYTITSLTQTGTSTALSNGPHPVYSITLDRAIGSEWTGGGTQFATINQYDTVGGINYSLTDGTLFDNGDTTFLHQEQLQLTHDTDSPFTIGFDTGGAQYQTSENTVVDFTTVDAFMYNTGDTLTFDRYYEFAREVSAFVSSGTDSDNNFTAVLQPNNLQVGDFYGYRQPSILGNTTVPSVTAVDGDTVTLSATPVENYDTTLSGARVYGLRYVGGSGADGEPAVDASLTVSKFELSDPNPQVGEEIEDVRITSVSSSFANFTLGLAGDISPIPTVGDTLTIPRTVITPGTPAIPGVDAVPAGPDIVTTIEESLSLSAKCIGSIADEPNSKIYWFVITEEYDGIYEFSTEDGNIAPLLRGDLNFSINNLITGINIIDGMLFWTDNLNEPRKLNIAKWKKANNSAVPTRIYSRNFVESDLTVIKPHPKTILSVDTSTDASKEILPFEEIFPQFAYRWKYSDGEYSPFSFFTPPVFEVADYETKQHFKEGYNKAARNIITEITLSNIPKGNEDVISLDILYTESISSTVYTLKTIRKKDFGREEYITPQVFTKRSFYSAIPANQLSRHFDSIPNKAKSQEVTANRLIYGNYDFGFEQPASLNLKTTQVDKSETSGLSVKSLRDYEIGTVYEDQFGRQGALITGDGGGYSTKFSTDQTQQLQTKITSAAPEWATHFKHYVKESSNDHHNFPVYNTFNDGEGSKNNSEFVWLQIDSNDRNKVSEDTFIIPRRHTHGDVITGNGTNSLAFTRRENSIRIEDMNVHDRLREREENALIFAGGSNPSSDFPTSRQGSQITDAEDWIFTCAVAGKYTFEFQGELEWVSRTSNFKNRDLYGPAKVNSSASFQKVDAGNNFASLAHNFEHVSSFNITQVKSTGNENRDFKFYTAIEYDLEIGDRVRPVIVKTLGRSTGKATMDLVGGIFRTLTTPVDPNADVPPVEQFNHIIKDVSKHKIIEIENEAPDIVRSQLPVETSKIGNTIEVTSSVNPSTKKLFLTDGFQESNDSVETGYDENSTELFYEVGSNASGFKQIPFISALNNILGNQNLGSLTISEDITTLQPAEYIETVDVTEVEGGLWFGIGPSGISTVTNKTENKVKIKEIGLGYSQYNVTNTNNARDILKIVLEEPVGINPMAQDIAFFKGNLTENALKNIQGSFFAKVKRATGNGGINTRRQGFSLIKTPFGYPNITTAQSTFNEENEVNTLQTIWFETIPDVEDSNLNLFWEATPSIPISEHGEAHKLDFYNCVAFVQDGVFLETQRVFDKFNSVQMTKGVRVNVPQENYAKEHRKAGLIFSGIYNSRTGINRLNEFVYSDGITKDLEPNYGSLQKLHTRDTNLVAFCEDKVFTIMADKDILFSGSGSPQVTASNRVLGQTTPFLGDFGIGFEPASFASYANRMYFVDRVRGSVIRISTDGITQISEAGMNDFFRDKLANNNSKIIGSYDSYKNQYVLTLDDYSLTFSEKNKGWVSRVSYVPENGISINNNFYTFNSGDLWQHYSLGSPRNNFYGEQYNSSLTTVFNAEPSAIKSFKTINYEGTPGWEVPLVLTDQQAGFVIDFENKEGKWYNNINGVSNKNIAAKINSLIDDDVLDFYKSDLFTESTGSLSPEDIYNFSDETDSSKNSHLGIGQLTGIALSDGGTPTEAQGNTTITFNVQ